MQKINLTLLFLLYCLSVSVYADILPSFTPQKVSEFFPVIPLQYKGNPYFTDGTESVTRARTFEQTVVDALKNLQSKINISAYQIPPADMTSLYLAVLYRHPELFWVVTGHNGGLSNGTYVTTIYPLYTETDKSVLATMSNAFNSAVSQAISTTTQATSDIEKALLLHDWLASHCMYDSERSCTYRNSAYGALVSGSAVCQGYTMAYAALLAKVDIASEFIRSDSLNHAWNLITIDGQAYHVDVTWDDGTSTQDLSTVEHVYFLLNDQGIKEQVSHHSIVHTGWNDETSLTSTSDRFNSYFWRSSSIQTTSLPCCQGYAYVFYNKTLRKYRLSDGVCMNDACVTVDDHAVAAFYRSMIVYNTASQLSVYNYSHESVHSIPFSFDNHLGHIISLYQPDSSSLLQAVIAPSTSGNTFSYIDIPWTHPTSISRSKSSVSIASTTRNFSLSATVQPVDCTCGDIIWNSSRPDIAAVDTKGNITPLALGSTTITATTLDTSLTASCSLTVTSPQTTITLSAQTAALIQKSLDDSGTVSAYQQWGTVTGNGIFPADTDVTLTAIPMTGYTLAYWLDSLSGCPIGYDSPSLTVCAQNNTTFTAVFKRSVYSCQATSSDQQLGTVSPATPVNTLYETTETFTAEPANGCVFLAWVDPDNNQVVSVSPTWSVPITREHTVYRAIFARQDDARLLTHITIQPSEQELPSGQTLSIIVTAVFNDGTQHIIDQPKLALDVENTSLAELNATCLTNTNTTRSHSQAIVSATYTDKSISQYTSCTVTLLGIPDACLWLQPGWNLIGFCAKPTADSLSSLQQDVVIRSRQTDSRTYVPATDINMNTGYFVYNDSATTAKLTFDSCQADADELNLHVGWNIIGIPQALTAEDSLLKRTDLTFWKLDSTGKYYRVCPDQLEKGQGYLVHRSIAD